VLVVNVFWLTPNVYLLQRPCPWFSTTLSWFAFMRWSALFLVRNCCAPTDQQAGVNRSGCAALLWPQPHLHLVPCGFCIKNVLSSVRQVVWSIFRAHHHCHYVSLHATNRTFPAVSAILCREWQLVALLKSAHMSGLCFGPPDPNPLVEGLRAQVSMCCTPAALLVACTSHAIHGVILSIHDMRYTACVLASVDITVCKLTPHLVGHCALILPANQCTRSAGWPDLKQCWVLPAEPGCLYQPSGRPERADHRFEGRQAQRCHVPGPVCCVAAILLVVGGAVVHSAGQSDTQYVAGARKRNAGTLSQFGCCAACLRHTVHVRFDGNMG
jgi:hypothetical protein